MENYVLIYHFENKKDHLQFEEQINIEFPKNRTDDEIDSLQYFGFAGREQQEVVDKLNTILNRFGTGTKDFVALFYARKEDPDTIKRLMLIGHDDLVETKVKNISIDAHRNSLTKLLNIDYTREKSSSL